MSKKRRKKSNSAFLDMMLDFSSGIAMNVIANKMEEKYCYRKKGVPNPYRASAYGFATGHIRNTNDILKLGCSLGAMGSFDEDYEMDTSASKSYKNKVYSSCSYFKPMVVKINDNRYAWRLNCQDGDEFGISPEAFETREEYNTALFAAKETKLKNISPKVSLQAEDEVADYEEPETKIYYKVSLIDSGKNDYYFSDNDSIHVGDFVIVPTEKGETKAIVIQIKKYNKMNLPKPIDETLYVIKKWKRQ